MRDAAELERRGVPTVTIAHDMFEGAARAQGRALGLPTLRLAVVSRTKAWETTEEIIKKADDVMSTVVSQLVQPTKEPAV